MSHGPRAVHDLIQEEGWEYPVSIERLRNARPLANVTLNERGDSVLLAELLIEVEADRFTSSEHLAAALEPVIEAEVESRRPGLLGWVKRLIPWTSDE